MNPTVDGRDDIDARLRFSQQGRHLFSVVEDSRTIYKEAENYKFHPDQGQTSASMIGEHGPPTATSTYTLWDTFNITAAISTSREVLTLEAKHLDTADEFEIALLDGNLTNYNGFFNDVSAFYDFMTKALSVAMPVPVTGGISGDEATAYDLDSQRSSDISCVTWLADDHSAIYIDAKLKPVYSFIPPLSVSLKLPRVRNGTADQRQQRTLEKLTSEFREALAEQGRQFSAKMDTMTEVMDVLTMQVSNRIAFRGGYTLPMDVEMVVVANSSIYFQNSAINSPDGIYYRSSDGTTGLAALTRDELDKANSLGTSASSYYYYSYVSPMFHLVADQLGRIPQQWALTQGGLLPSNITSDELRPLTLCTNITYLDLSHAKLTHLSFLPSLKKLETLVLRGASELTDLEPAAWPPQPAKARCFRTVPSWQMFPCSTSCPACRM